MGVALTSCTVPAAGKPTFELGENEMELGVGIHGEPGRERLPLASAKEIAELLLDPILADLPFSKGDDVIAFVNGLGGTPLIELYVHVQRGQQDCVGARHQHRAFAGRAVHHLARDGRCVGDTAQGGRRVAGAVGRSGEDAGFEMGYLSR